MGEYSVKINNRIDWIDFARGIGILLVLYGHTVFIPRPVCTLIYSFHMPLFFVLSGFCFHADINPKAFFAKKTRSLLIPYVSFTAVYALVFFIKHLVSNNLSDYSLTALYLFIQKNGYIYATWFLIVLFVTESLFYFIVRLFRQRLIGITAASLTVLAGGIVYFKTVNAWLPFLLQVVFTSLPFFFLGYLFAKRKLTEQLSHPVWTVLFGMATILLFVIKLKYFGYFTALHANQYGNFFLYYLIAVCAVIFVLLLSDKIKRISPINYLGRNTIVLFTLQQLVITEPLKAFVTANFGAQAVGNTDSFYKLLFSVIELVTSLAVLLLLNYVIQKTPMRIILGKTNSTH